MSIFYKILILALISYGLIWLSVYQIDPDPSISIEILLLVPFVFLLNLIIGGILFYLKKKEYAILFFTNSIIASIMMFYLFGKGIDRHQNNRLESWEFQKFDSIFTLTRWKKNNDFSMSYSLSPGSSWGFLDGKCIEKNGELYLTSDSLNMKIIKNKKLIGFRKITDTIRINKRER